MLPWPPPDPVLLLCGDASAELARLPAGIAQCCVTSPPYYGLRSYGTAPQVWGGDPACDHAWVTAIRRRGAGGEREYGSADGGAGRGPAPSLPVSATCTRCNAWRGELGAEPTPDLYVAHLVAVFRAVRRVLRPDGTLWVTLGDAYSQEGRGGGASGGKNGHSAAGGYDQDRKVKGSGLGPKQLLMLPARFALAMQADGWILRSDIIWAKRAPMPESVQDRPTRAHEHIFLFAARPRYFYDAQAIAEPVASGNWAVKGGSILNDTGWSQATGKQPRRSGTESDPTTRNAWDYWVLGPESFGGPHYACFPSEIPRRAILAGTSAHGQCPACGTPWQRVTARALTTERPRDFINRGDDARGRKKRMGDNAVEITGWAPGCQCQDAGDPVPQVALDPFVGSGTTLAVAGRLGRRAVGVELNPEYIPLAEARIAAATPWYADRAATDERDGWHDLPLFAGVAP